jgi:small GTP-binding protein
MFDRLGVPPEKRVAITKKLNEMLSYKPKIGIFGKTGVGKSSLCNALFGQDLFAISDVESCTRNPQEELLNMGGKGITLLDVPGVGESQDRDEEYGKLYASLLPELDLALWVLKGDDRAFSSDELFYKSIVKPHQEEGKPFFFVLNQVDKIEPFREWNEAEHRPGVNQFTNIDKKIDAVSRAFECPKTQIIPVSANEKYNLSGLVDTFIFALPREQKFTVGRTVKPENVSKTTQVAIEASWFDTVKDVVVEVWDAARDIKEAIWDGFKLVGGMIWDNITGGCYITTATCEILGKPDNCYELNLFRHFRDNWLEQQPDGKSLVEEYYATAPQIVQSINRQREHKRIYHAIWNEYLSDCLHMIEVGDYSSCKEKYVMMVRNLEREYL